jgi:hypothetical protein
MQATRLMLGSVLTSLALSVGFAHADTFTYDFSGNFANHFSGLVTSGGTSVQSNGELQFYAAALDNISGAGTNQIFGFSPFVPTYGQSWSAKLDVRLPLSLDGLPNPDWYLSVGIGVVATASSDGTTLHAFNGIEIGNDQTPAGRKFNPEVVIDGTEIGDGVGVTPTSAESATLTLSFDAATKILTFGDLSGAFRTFDTSTSHLQSGDRMQIDIGFSGAASIPPGISVSQDTPLALDNFSVTTPVPETDTYVLFFGGLAWASWIARRGKRADLRPEYPMWRSDSDMSKASC